VQGWQARQARRGRRGEEGEARKARRGRRGEKGEARQARRGRRGAAGEARQARRTRGATYLAGLEQRDPQPSILNAKSSTEVLNPKPQTPNQTLSSVSDPLTARILSLCNSCTMSPANRLYVRGMRM